MLVFIIFGLFAYFFLINNQQPTNNFHQTTPISCVKASANIHNNNANFEHLIEHDLSCTLERNDEDVSYVSELRFGTMDEVLNVRQMRLH